MVYLLVFLSVAAMTAAQLLLKKGLLLVGESPGRLGDLLPFLLKAYTNVYVASAVLLAILTAMAWTLAVARAELSRIYPFMALSYALAGHRRNLRWRVSGGQELEDIGVPDYHS